jgi:hypothetical protein
MEQIDAVITWVDGSDPIHIQKINKAKGLNLKDESENMSATRYASNFEINYCVLSILKFAPWINNIYIVTDNQSPKIFEDVSKHFPNRLNDIKIIDHQEIFEGYEDALPNFNSTSIESCLWRIKEISNKFVYFNDDFILIRPVEISDFFIGDRPVLTGSWIPTIFYRDLYEKLRMSLSKNFHPRFSFNLGQWRSAKLIGKGIRYWGYPHGPYPINKDVLQVFYLKNLDIFKENIKHQFRKHSQFISIALNYHLEIFMYNNRNFKPDKNLYLKPKNGKPSYFNKKINQLRENKKFNSICAQSLDIATKEQRIELYHILDQTIAKVDRNG